ncbi:hypothetical protein GCM10011613_20190 [Cellvibrio zantedeschiae]|uniref:OmpR/PhoB-type domain-containing protein n=1 Tax=Cellvibrio zantedeschiae TaxID=1237077 RepID=A0ABQ3B1A5_9GAMM|nr:winged helix-turn-helix domain-containing protein [Cellvibrio zantedeschiae]GGY74691.1 hypothetical protein GCM10011613_20190 [Cellvibrio zantedeschiae]
MSGFAGQKFSFGSVRVDPLSNIILIEGKEKRVEPKLIALLAYLAQHAKEVVTRQQITEAIWPDVIVGDESITQAIFALRNLLGDDAKQPKYIETIPKKGYRFLADVTLLETENTDTNTSSTRPKNIHKLIALLAGAGVVTISILIWFFLQKTTDDKIVSIRPVTKMDGVEGDMAINRKHQMVFLNHTFNGNAMYLKDLRTGIQERITTKDWYITPQPVWLDDDTILYSRCSMSRECEIVRQKLPDQPQVIYKSKTGITEVIVRPDQSNELFFSEADDFVIFNMLTGKSESLRSRYNNLPLHVSHPLFSQNGKTLYFIYKFEQAKLMALDLTTGTVSTISDKFDEIHSVSYNHHQQLMVAGNIDSVPGLWLVNAQDSEPKLFLRSVNGELYVRAFAAPDEHAIYCQTVRLNVDNVVLDAGKETANEMPNLNSTGLDTGAIFSHDEQFIYFISDRSGFVDIWQYDVHKKQEKPVTNVKSALFEYLSLSHNGQYIAAIYMDKAQLVFGIFSTASGELLAQKPTKLMPLNWSLDDKSIYVADMKNNDGKILRLNSQTLEVSEVKSNAGLYAQEFDNGQSLIFFDFGKTSFVKRNLINGEEIVLASSIPNPIAQLNYHVPRVDPKGESVFTVYRDAQTYKLVQYPFNNNTKEPISLFAIPQNTNEITHINSDGTKAITNRVVAAAGDMLKIELAH